MNQSEIKDSWVFGTPIDGSSYTNYNNITETGLYYMNNTSRTNQPSQTNNGWLFVSKWNDQYVFQIMIVNSLAMYIRNMADGTWKSWVTI